MSGGRPLELSWPLQPLLDRTGRSLEQLAARAGYRRSNVWRLEQRGYLSDAQADLFATRAGLHPGLVWPEWFDVEVPAVDRLEVAPLLERLDRSVARFLRDARLNSRSWYRWVELGSMPAGSALAAAAALGADPGELWPEAA